ncbi:SNF2 family N-terminal domain-containing protein [Pavlovales sp. CCMP2436]|nr:SNF2 family N-terminal domain-containing protein [Pavlovales sp. CCMP2436]
MTTLQTITYLGYLKFECGIEGPSLIVAPLSVLSSWVAEFERWCPRMRVVRLHTADNKERELLRTEMLADVRTYDVVLTTYEMAASQNMQSILCGRMSWRYLVLDEGHRIKNERTIQYERLRHVRCQRKLLLTGTPLQNNMHELWALMHFLHPALFAHAEVFDSAFDLNRQTVDEEVLHKVHELLGTFVLRRVKADVLRSLPKKTEVRLYVPMSRTQQQLSKLLLLQDGELLDRMRTRQQLMAGGAESLLMSLRKCCNHPHLFPAMTRVSERLGETLATASGKLCILDRLLRRLFADGHRVVLFSFFTSMLDILEQYFDERNIP